MIPILPATSSVATLFDLSGLNDTYKTRELSIRKTLFEMTKPSHMISSIYKAFLRGIKSEFSDLVTIDSEGKVKETRLIMANPERAVAKITQDDNIILPVLSVSQTTTDSDPSRSRYESMLIHEKYWDDSKQRAVRVLSFAPVPVSIKYQLNVWSKYNEDLDQLVEQIRVKFNPELTIKTEFSTLTKAFIEGESIIGATQVADKEDRVLRKQFSIVIKSYIPNPKFLVTSTGKIERLMDEYAIS